MGVVAGPSMAHSTCSLHDPGFTAGNPGQPLTADKDTDEPRRTWFSMKRTWGARIGCQNANDEVVPITVSSTPRGRLRTPVNISASNPIAMSAKPHTMPVPC